MQLLHGPDEGLEVTEMPPWLDLRVPPKDVKLPAVEAHRDRCRRFAAPRFRARSPGTLMQLTSILMLTLLVANTPARACGNDSAAVRAVAEGIVAADNGRDIGRVLAYYAVDAVLMPPNEPPVTDRAIIQQRYEDLFQNFAPQIDTRIDEICVVGDLAFVRGHNGGWLVSRVGGRSNGLDDIYLMILQRTASGEWKISRLMWHPARGPTH